jgi:hypothetical protein
MANRKRYVYVLEEVQAYEGSAIEGVFTTPEVAMGQHPGEPWRHEVQEANDFWDGEECWTTLLPSAQFAMHYVVSKQELRGS